MNMFIFLFIVPTTQVLYAYAVFNIFHKNANLRSDEIELFLKTTEKYNALQIYFLEIINALIINDIIKISYSNYLGTCQIYFMVAKLISI